MPLEMVHLNDRNAQGKAQGLGERSTHEEGAEKARTAGERDRGKVGSLYACTRNCLADNRNYILLMCPGSQFRHNSSICLVYILAGDHVRQQPAIGNDGRRSVVAR